MTCIEGADMIGLNDISMGTSDEKRTVRKSG